MKTMIGLIVTIGGIALLVIGLALIVRGRGPLPPDEPHPEKLRPPVFSPLTSSFQGVLQVTISSPDGARIKATSFAGDSWQTDEGETLVVILDNTRTLSAYCFGEGKQNSDLETHKYTRIASPEPEPPADLPDGEYGLAKQTRDWLASLVPRQQHAKAASLAESFRRAYDDVQANPGQWTIGLVQQALSQRNVAIIGDGRKDWEEFGFRLKVTLDDLEASSKIANVRQYAQACLEISWGFAAINTNSLMGGSK